MLEGYSGRSPGSGIDCKGHCGTELEEAAMYSDRLPPGVCAHPGGLQGSTVRHRFSTAAADWNSPASASLLSLRTGVKTAHSHGLPVNPHSPDTPRCSVTTSVSHVETEARQDPGMTEGPLSRTGG